MFIQPLDLTTALRPSLLPDETLLFVQDAVGLYEGKFKIPQLQNGHAYLTSYRICYVDNLEPRKSSIAIELRNIEKFEFYGGFLKSSAKITLYPKIAKRPSVQDWNHPNSSNSLAGESNSSHSGIASTVSRGSSPFATTITGSISQRPGDATWICPICSFSNPIPSNFDIATANSHTTIPACLACGIKPSLAHVLKAAINASIGRQPYPNSGIVSSDSFLETHGKHDNSFSTGYKDSSNFSKFSPQLEAQFQCPRCTFRNHPQLLSCELCGASLLSTESLNNGTIENEIGRADSPGPTLEGSSTALNNMFECVKLSFRAGGDKIFYERLKGAMVQRKWLLKNAPPIPKPGHTPLGLGTLVHGTSIDGSRNTPERPKVVGIAGLERLRQEQRKNNELVIGSAFEDLEALMASAKEIVKLAETFAKPSENSSDASALILESATALGMVTTKEMLGSGAGSRTLYLSELSRNLAEYLTDDGKGILKKEGGIMSLVDLWAIFSRAKGGIDLVSPSDFEKAARLWEKLNLPVRLRQFKSGLLVVQRHDWTDSKTIAQMLAWLQELRGIPPPGDIGWNWAIYGRGVTAQETAQKFGWSIGIATEELEMAEEIGVLCREENVQGLRFWENFIVHQNTPAHHQGSTSFKDDEIILRNLKEMGFGG